MSFFHLSSLSVSTIAFTLSLAACAVDDGSGAETSDGETETTGDDSTTGEDVVCEDAVDEPPTGTSVTIRVLNTRDEPIWLAGGDCLTFSRFEIEYDFLVGTDKPDEGEACDLVLQTSACAPLGCEGDYFEEGAIRLGPGASWEFDLDAYYYPMLEVPGSCQEQGLCEAPISCRAGRAIPDGASLQIRTIAQTGCLDYHDAGYCDCAEGETCEMPASEHDWYDPVEREISIDNFGDADEYVIEFG